MEHLDRDRVLEQLREQLKNNEDCLIESDILEYLEKLVLDYNYMQHKINTLNSIIADLQSQLDDN